MADSETVPAEEAPKSPQVSITSLKEKATKVEDTNGNSNADAVPAAPVNGSSTNGSSKSSGSGSEDEEDEHTKESNAANGNHVENGVQQQSSGSEDDSDVQMLSSVVNSSSPSPLPSTSKVIDVDDEVGDDGEGEGEGEGDSVEDEEESDDEMEEDDLEQIGDDEDDGEVEEVKDSSSDSDIMEIDAEDTDAKQQRDKSSNVVTIDNMETLRSLANDAKRRQEEAVASGEKSSSSSDVVDAAASLLSGKANSSGVTITPTSAVANKNKPNFAAASLPPGLTISQTSHKTANISNILNRNRSPAAASSSSASLTSKSPVQQQLNDPNLTDDTFVVEAPSFIVPYVYEKPPKETITDFKKSIEDLKEKKEEKKEEDKKEESKKEEKKEEVKDEATKPKTYFESVLGKFIIDLGMNLVQETVQQDLLKEQQKRSQKDKSAGVMHAIMSLKKNIETSQEKNKDFSFEMIKCRFCSFRTESQTVMEHHLESPHMTRMGMTRCNHCRFELKTPQDVVNHMLLEHGVRGRVNRMPAIHQCPQCPYEDNMKGKLTRHKVGCDKRFRIERNQDPPHDWEPPAKIPKPAVVRGRPLPNTQYGSGFMATGMKQGINPLQYQNQRKAAGMMPQLQFGPRGINRPVGRPGMNFMAKNSSQMLAQQNMKGLGGLNRMNNQVVLQALNQQGSRSILPNLGNNSSVTIQSIGQRSNAKSTQPSISITPLPGRAGARGPGGAGGNSPMTMKPGQPGGMNKGGFVICEICDGYIRDLEQLRNHMQWIHKVKIHPKMIYNRPPLNCQKCQFRFFTDQGLERHLLGSHGLVTASMQDLANKSQDSGRCPVCGKVYQWKLLNHVAKDHMKVLKPAHLSYKCTVCTATFGQYKLFENHVYTAHSGGNRKGLNRPTNSSSQATVKAPIKVSDEITIIPQKSSPSSKSASAARAQPSGSKQNVSGSADPDVIELDDDEEEIDDEMKESNDNSNTGDSSSGKRAADESEDGEEEAASGPGPAEKRSKTSSSSPPENGNGNSEETTKQVDSGEEVEGVEEISDEENDD